MARRGDNLAEYFSGLFGGTAGNEPVSPGGGSSFTEKQPGYTIPDTGAVNLGTSAYSPADIAAQNKQYGGASGGQSVEDWLRQYQAGNSATEGIGRTLTGLQGAGYNASPYMYGNTPSGNELSINGQKTKILSENGGGTPSWYTGGNDSGPSGGGGGYTGGQGGMGFADPAYQQLLDLANRRIGQLGQPTSFPQFDQYLAALNANQAQARQRAQDFAGQLTSRIGELQQPLLSGADSARIRAQYQNQTQAERDRALQSNADRLGNRGFAPTSGLLEGSNRATNQAYDARTGNIDATLANQAIAADEQRRNMGTRLQQLAYQALQGGDLGALQSAASAADLENQRFGIDQARQREMLSTAGIPVELSNQGLQNALSTLGSGGSPNSALSGLFGALGLAQQQQGLDTANTAGLFGGIGALLPTLLKYLVPQQGVGNVPTG